MGWADGHIARLKAGETVQFRPHGNSMQPRIQSGQLVTVAPVTDVSELGVSTIVLCKVSGRQHLHLISAVRHETSFQISNNKGHVNGWIGLNGIYGKVIRVDP